MRYQTNIISITFLILLVAFSCDSKLEQTSQFNTVSGSSQYNGDITLKKQVINEKSEIEIDKIENLISSLKTNNIEKQNLIVNQLLEISEKSLANKKFIENQLIFKTKEMCIKDEVINIDTDFRKLNAMSHILAKLKSQDALNILIDCSNHSTVFSGDSSTDFATMPAIVEFGDKAVPLLKKKLISDDRKNIKCQIVSILTLINTKEAENTLKYALKIETDKEAMVCITRGIRSFNNNR